MADEKGFTTPQKFDLAMVLTAHDFPMPDDGLAKELTQVRELAQKKRLPWQIDPKSNINFTFLPQVTFLYNSGFDRDSVAHLQGFAYPSRYPDSIDKILLRDADRVKHEVAMSVIKAWHLQALIDRYFPERVGNLSAREELHEMRIKDEAVRVNNIFYIRLAQHDHGGCIQMIQQARQDGDYLASIQLAQSLIEDKGEINRNDPYVKMATAYQITGLVHLATKATYENSTSGAGIEYAVETEIDVD